MGAFSIKGDKIIWMTVVMFALFSVVAVFSSSSFLASSQGTSKLVIFLEQIKSVLLGMCALFVCYLIPMRWYRNLAFIYFGICVAMLLMLYIPPFQARINGAVRGIKIASHTIQPFEFAKVGMVLYLARAIEKWEDSLDTYKDFFLKIALPIFAVCGLIVSNSVSSTLLVGGISMLVLVFMEIRWKYIFAMMGVILLAAGLMYVVYTAAFKGNKERLETPAGKIFNRFGTVENRFASFKTDEKEEVDRESKRQSENAMIAISEGGLFGKGPGNSTQRYSLSMAFSDFIFAFIVEEYGLAGGSLIIALYIVLLFRCIRLTTRCRTSFSSALVTGLAYMIIIQAFIHILVNVRLIPITGQTLPLISHGGTAYLAMSGAVGIILSVNKQLDKQDMMEAARLNVENQQIGNNEIKPEDNN